MQGSGPPAAGPALAILATAPRPGLVLTGLCPPLLPAETAALQTAWLKVIAQELPGVAVHLFGRPADAMPMLRYFAGPGVQLLEWREPGAAPPDLPVLLRAAEVLLARGHAPVAVRTIDVPDATAADVLGCLRAAAAGDSVVAADQRGAPWLVAAPDRPAVEALREGRAARHRRGPWARSVQHPDDLALLLRERAADGPAAALPVRDLQAALRYHEVVFTAELIGRTADTASLAIGPARVLLQQRGHDFARNGLRLRCQDLHAMAEHLRAHGCIAPADDLAESVGGGMDATATDQDGNRLTFTTASSAR